MAMLMVSVVMVTYRHEEYIKKAIESVLSQECNYEYELIVANDNSPDDTDSIVNKIIKEHPKGSLITYVRHSENLGMMNNFIWVVNEGKGKYIALCEGDDYWTDSTKLQKQVEFLEANHDYAGCGNQSTILINNEERHIFKNGIPDEITIKDIIGPRLMHTSAVIFRKTIFTLMNNAPKVLSGDRLLYFFIAISGRFKFFQETMGIYRIHELGMSSNATLDQILLDLNSIPYLKKVYPAFPKYRYMSYVYATVGLWKKGSFIRRFYYIILSFLLSFSYFPQNIFKIFSYIKNRL